MDPKTDGITDDHIAAAMLISPQFGRPRPPAWSMTRLIAIGRHMVEAGFAPTDIRRHVLIEHERSRVKVTMPKPYRGANFENTLIVQLREGDDEAKATGQMDETRRAARRRHQCMATANSDPGRIHANHVVAAALANLTPTTPRSRISDIGGAHFERCDTAYTTAHIPLGEGASFNQADAKCWVEIEGRIPDTLAIACVGRRISTIVDHRWLHHDELVVTGLERTARRTRFVLAFVWAAALPPPPDDHTPKAASERSLPDMAAS